MLMDYHTQTGMCFNLRTTGRLKAMGSIALSQVFAFLVFSFHSF